MHPGAWAALLRHIPKAIHDQLLLVTTGGREITIQTILRIDHELLVLKGRVAATQDAGRLFLVPYAQIDYLGFQRAVKEAEYEEWFGTLVLPRAAVSQEGESAALMPAEAVEGEVPAAGPKEPTAPAAPQVPAGGSKTVSPAVKSVVLERFRMRGQTSGVRPRVNVPNPTKGTHPAR
jgi:hypothetical protein